MTLDQQTSKNKKGKNFSPHLFDRAAGQWPLNPALCRASSDDRRHTGCATTMECVVSCWITYPEQDRHRHSRASVGMSTPFPITSPPMSRIGRAIATMSYAGTSGTEGGVIAASGISIYNQALTIFSLAASTQFLDVGRGSPPHK